MPTWYTTASLPGIPQHPYLVYHSILGLCGADPLVRVVAAAVWQFALNISNFSVWRVVRGVVVGEGVGGSRVVVVVGEGVLIQTFLSQTLNIF